MATPRWIQCAWGMSEGTRMSRMKFVEWPVVARMPRRSDVAALGAAVDRACGVDGAPPPLAQLCRFHKTQERAVVQAVVGG